MSICRKRGRDSYTVIACTDLTSRKTAIDSIRRNSFWTPTPRRLAGEFQWSDAFFGYTIGHPDEDLSRNDQDSAAGAAKAVVIDPAFSWGNDAPPNTPWHKTIIYELHVKGFTMRHPAVPPELRGTYAALTCPPVIDYLKASGHHRGGIDAGAPVSSPTSIWRTAV